MGLEVLGMLAAVPDTVKARFGYHSLQELHLQDALGRRGVNHCWCLPMCTFLKVLERSAHVQLVIKGAMCGPHGP
jgi:hypothetical protein